MSKLFTRANFQIKSSNDDEAFITGIFSTEDQDRHGDVVMQNFELKNYKNNPVILDSHRYESVLDVVGKATKIGVRDGKLQGKIQFAVNENPKARVIYDLYKNGFVKTFSIGFMPKAFDPQTGAITKSELFEISTVSVPANAMALAKQKGINVEKLYEPITKDEKTELAENRDNSKDGRQEAAKENNSETGTGKEQPEATEKRDEGAVEKSQDEPVKTKATDFPNEGDDKKVSLRNSEHDQFDYRFASGLKENYPDIWDKGGNIRGNEAFILWGKARKGDDSEAVVEWIKEREAWAARHKENHRLAGVVAQVKWGVVGSRGEAYMKNLIQDEIDKAEKVATKPDLAKVLTKTADIISEINSMDCAAGNINESKKQINRAVKDLLSIKRRV